MRLFIFESEANTGLRAFAGDAAGRKLPDQFRPWREIGSGPLGERSSLQTVPRYDRRGISAHGFQLWRVKPKMAKPG